MPDMFLYINTQKGLKNFFWRASSGKYSVQLLENLATLVNIPFAFMKFFCVKFLLRKTPWQKSSLLLSTWLNAKVSLSLRFFTLPFIGLHNHGTDNWRWERTAERGTKLSGWQQDSQLLISHHRNREVWQGHSMERKSSEKFTIMGELSLKHIDLGMNKSTKITTDSPNDQQRKSEQYCDLLCV